MSTVDFEGQTAETPFQETVCRSTCKIEASSGKYGCLKDIH